MTDSNSPAAKDLPKKKESNRIAPASSGQPKKKSSLAINIAQKPAKKSRPATSRLDLENGAKESAAKEPTAEQIPEGKKKKKSGGLSITSKIRRPKKTKDKKLPLPPVAGKPAEPKPGLTTATKAARTAIPPIAKEPTATSSLPPVASKQDTATKPPVVSKLSQKLIDSADGKKAAPGKPHPPSIPPPVAGKPAGGVAEKDSAVAAEVEKKKPPPLAKLSAGEPETLLSLLEPDPEEVTKLKQGTKQDRFLSQSVVLEESGLSTLVRSSILLVAVLILAFFVWASYSIVDEMASTTGQVIPNSPIQVIQHLEGGIVEEIYVQEGQIIKKGGELVRLSAKAALADLNQMRAKLASLTAQKARLIAMIEGEGADFSAIPEEYAVIIQGQIKLLSAQRSNFESKLAVSQTQVERTKSRVDNFLDQQNALQRQLSYSDQEMQVRKLGYEKGLMSRLRVIAAQRDKVRVESELVRVVGELVGSRRDLSTAQSELAKLIDSNREENLRELGVITADYSQVIEGITRLEDRVARLTIFSPVWGIVKELSMKTIGGVIAPGSVLTEIIPLDATRRVETKISTKDIGHVNVGQGVTVKISTFDFARYGGFDGILESISPTTFTDPSGEEPYYLGIVRLAKSHVGSDPKVNQVLPGMTVQADINTGSKTIMEYLLKPIFASVNKSFRER